MLSVKNLRAQVAGKEILKGIDLEVKAGEVHASMGPNGSGKSTLASVLAGNEKFTVTGGEATFLEQDLLSLPIEERACMGLFLGFQYPVEIPGVSMANFMKMAVNEQRKFRGEKPLAPAEFLKLVREKSAIVELDSKLISRSVNEGFSGGEKKKVEMLQLLLLQPKLAILDETDSGLDVDALSTVSHGMDAYRKSCDGSMLIITHNTRILEHLDVDRVHVMVKGHIVREDAASLIHWIAKNGFETFEREAAEQRAQVEAAAAEQQA